MIILRFTFPHLHSEMNHRYFLFPKSEFLIKCFFCVCLMPGTRFRLVGLVPLLVQYFNIFSDLTCGVMSSNRIRVLIHVSELFCYRQWSVLLVQKAIL